MEFLFLWFLLGLFQLSFPLSHLWSISSQVFPSFRVLMVFPSFRVLSSGSPILVTSSCFNLLSARGVLISPYLSVLMSMEMYLTWLTSISEEILIKNSPCWLTPPSLLLVLDPTLLVQSHFNVCPCFRHAEAMRFLQISPKAWCLEFPDAKCLQVNSAHCPWKEQGHSTLLPSYAALWVFIFVNILYKKPVNWAGDMAQWLRPDQVQFSAPKYSSL